MELFNFLWYIVRKTVKKERNLAELLELYTHGKWNLMVLKLLRVCFKCLTNTLQKLDTHARNTVIRITYLLDFVIDCRRETYFDCCYIILKFLNRNSSKVFFFVAIHTSFNSVLDEDSVDIFFLVICFAFEEILP